MPSPAGNGSPSSIPAAMAGPCNDASTAPPSGPHEKADPSLEIVAPPRAPASRTNPPLAVRSGLDMVHRALDQVVHSRRVCQVPRVVLVGLAVKLVHPAAQKIGLAEDDCLKA